MAVYYGSIFAVQSGFETHLSHLKFVQGVAALLYEMI